MFLFLFSLVASLGFGIQYANAVTANQSKIQALHNLVIPGFGGVSGTSIFNAPYKVTVTFDSMTVINNHHHPILCVFLCAGTWELAAFVQGKVVDLANDNNLESVDDGQTIYFKPGTQVTVDVPKTLPLSIMTLGYEVDCGGPFDFGGFETHPLWSDIPEIVQILQGPQSQWFTRIQDIQISFYQYVTGGGFGSSSCQHEVLGFINKIYMPPGKSYEPIGYGAGAHTAVISNNGDFALRYTISVVAPPTLAGAQVEQNSGGCTTNLPITGVTSSASQPTFPPTNAIDNNPNTKWISTFTLNPFIRLDLGTQKSVCGVDIAWADGTTHQYRFNVSASTDGTTFANVLSGTSSGTTTSAEKYTFVAPHQARYVKITITQSTPGSADSIAQISEIHAYG